jgi:hypothetical protein
MILSKIDFADESLPVIASDDWATHRVCNYFFTNLLSRTGLLHDVPSLRLIALAGRQQ